MCGVPESGLFYQEVLKPNLRLCGLAVSAYSGTKQAQMFLTRHLVYSVRLHLTGWINCCRTVIISFLTTVTICFDAPCATVSFNRSYLAKTIFANNSSIMSTPNNKKAQKIPRGHLFIEGESALPNSLPYNMRPWARLAAGQRVGVQEVRGRLA